MPFALTPEALAAAYDYLCEFPPFSKWNMPPSEDVKFRVLKTKDRTAHYSGSDGHEIAVSSAYVARHEMLLSSMAHEMIHLHCHQTCWNRRNPHDRAFQKFADRVCKVHEFDRLTF
jgi:predicted SprT family Zn-dependent metalloprotease